MGLPYRYMSIDVSTTTMTLMLRRALGLGANLPFHIEDSLLSLTQANATSSLARVPGLLNRGNVSVVAAAQSCYPFLPTRGGMTRLSRPRAMVRKFHAHRNYAVTQVSATGFEPETIRQRIQHATTAPQRGSFLVQTKVNHVVNQQSAVGSKLLTEHCL